MIAACCHVRDDACKVLVDVYGANIDIRDFSGKKALHHLKGNQQLKHALGVRMRFGSNGMRIIHKIMITLIVNNRHDLYLNT